MFVMSQLSFILSFLNLNSQLKVKNLWSKKQKMVSLEFIWCLQLSMLIQWQMKNDHSDCESRNTVHMPCRLLQGPAEVGGQQNQTVDTEQWEQIQIVYKRNVYNFLSFFRNLFWQSIIGLETWLLHSQIYNFSIL